MTDKCNVRNRPYYPIVMPLNKDGYGPASRGDIDSITFEVWDRLCNSYESFDNLLDAVQLAEDMNEDYELSGKEVDG